MKHWLSQIELGKWYSNAQYYYRPRNDKERNLMHNCYEEGYNKGYEDGKPKWHNLREDPNDLPKDINTFVLNQDGEKCRKYPDLWIDIYGNGVTVIAWCELPKFEE